MAHRIAYAKLCYKTIQRIFIAFKFRLKLAKVFAYKGFVSSSRHHPKWDCKAITKLWDSSVLCSKLKMAKVDIGYVACRIQFPINSSSHIGHGLHIQNEQNSHNCGAAYISIKHAKCRFLLEFMWTWMAYTYHTVHSVSIKCRQHRNAGPGM